MKKIKISFIVVICLILLLAAGIFISGKNITIARCIVTEEGGVFMAYHGQPVKLNGVFGENYQTGDELFIIHDIAFAESYPAQTRTFFTLKMRSGSKDDIPEKILNVLKELKYIN